MEKPMIFEEKKKMAEDINKLPLEYKRGVWEIVTDKVIFDSLKEV